MSDPQPRHINLDSFRSTTQESRRGLRLVEEAAEMEEDRSQSAPQGRTWAARVPARSLRAPVAVAQDRGVGRHGAGLFFVVGAALLGSISISSWERAMHWAGPPWTSESFRWSVVALIATIGVSFLRARPIFVVIYSAMFAVTALTIDLLIGGKASRMAEAVAGPGGVMAALAAGSAAFGYLVYSDPSARAPSVRGIFGFLVVAAGATGVARGWFSWKETAALFGPAAVKVVSEWGHEVTWATVLVVTAIGVSFSRTRPVHLLNAVLLAGLAYYCVKCGYSVTKPFPELSSAAKTIQIEYESYTNVDMWRWVVAVELVCLAAVLLHMSLGMGAISLATALAWMFVGLAIYNSVSTMSVMRAGGTAVAIGMAPLENMGLPVTPSPTLGRGSDTPGMRALGQPTADLVRGAAPNGQALQAERFMQQVARPGMIRETTLTAWIILTAVFAGVIAVTGLRMMSEHVGTRIVAEMLLWLGLFLGAFALAWVWPKDPSQSWEEWLVAFKFSRYHVFVIWLVFVATMAVAGVWALLLSRRVGTWVHAAAAAVFLGTAASLVGAAVLIAFGGFPRLPVWIYCVIAAGQSSLAWALMLHANPPPTVSPARLGVHDAAGTAAP